MRHAIRSSVNSKVLRRTCALTALLALFLQGSSSGHMLLVEHTRCAEHGELVHDGRAHHHDAGAGVEVAAPVLEGVSGEAQDQAHEHCIPSADRRDALLAIVDAQVAPCSIAVSPGAPPADPFTAAAEKRFRVAPKNSPPA